MIADLGNRLLTTANQSIINGKPQCSFFKIDIGRVVGKPFERHEDRGADRLSVRVTQINEPCGHYMRCHF